MKDMERPADHEERMTVARKVAQWGLGDGSWAGLIVGAYLHPSAALDSLDREMADEGASK